MILSRLARTFNLSAPGPGMLLRLSASVAPPGGQRV